MDYYYKLFDKHKLCKQVCGGGDVKVVRWFREQYGTNLKAVYDTNMVLLWEARK